jgi:hypothetical protein
MKIHLADQRNHFKKHLNHLGKKKVRFYVKSQLTNRITTVRLNTNKNINELNLSCLFEYKIFPENILTYLTQWEDEKREMRIGDNIIQQVYLPPIPKFSQKIIFGVRICEIINQANRKGFSYETLEGHLEKGFSTFTIELEGNNTVFRIQTYSSPGNAITKLVVVPYQSFCTMKALKNIKRQIESLT